MLLDAQKSCLILVDMQEKLIPYVHNHEELVARCVWMIEVAGMLEIPTLVSEQYPQGLGATVSSIKAVTAHATVASKTEFSCGQNEDCYKKIARLNRPQVVLIGIETHVCVLQTAFDLQDQGKDVYIVADATESRRMQDKVLAIDRMQFAGINIISAEMALFEWCRDSKHPKFKELSQRFLR